MQMKRLGVIGFLLLTLSGCIANHGVFHEVSPGETLGEIGRSYNVDWQYLADINTIVSPRSLKVGDKVFVPGAYRHERPRGLSKPSPVKQVSPQIAETRIEEPVLSKPSPAKKPLPKSVGSRPKPSVDGYIWPAKGTVVKNFGETKGSVSRGLELKVGEEIRVRASAPGKVIYAGNGIAGYGNLVIIQHADKWFTVYGYNSKIEVEAGKFVSQGDVVAISGSAPDGRKGILHFEMRDGHDPVDPLKYLKK